jgi:putative membrane protein
MPSFHIHPDVWLLFGSILGLYFVGIRRHLRATGDATPLRRQRLFSLGVGILWLASSWPMHDLAERYLYSFHMTQHMLFTLVAAPLLIAGVPVWFYRELLRPKPVRTVFRFFTRPLVALIVFNTVLVFTHWPAVVAASVQSEPLHFLLHVAVVSSALAMWWPVMSPLPEMPTLSPPGQMIYLFLQSLVPTIPASFLTFGTKPLYPIYATFPRIWGVGAMTDQLMAGLIMKIVGSAILWVVIAVIFFRWYADEQRSDLDVTTYADVDRTIRTELNR